jgi:AmmeMemoRadiSam system protein B/AmmeMemoRadiSam system protein A
MELSSQSKQIDRQPVAAGRFYTADKETLKKELTGYFAECKKPMEGLNTRAIIVPHAGYVFTGPIAAAAFSATSRVAGYENIFIIGSSHIMAFDGASVYNTGDFITPLGRAVVNMEIGDKLKKDNSVFNFPTTAHLQDHCLEVQIPFIQYYYTVTPKIIPIIIGTTSTTTIKKIAEALKPYFTSNNLFIISSDFSHYPSYEDGNKADNVTATAIVSGDPAVFLGALKKNSSANIAGLVTSMCGWTSGLTLLDMAEGNKNLEFKRIAYCNSGDSPYGNKDKVVGYNAIALVEKEKTVEASQKTSDDFSFTKEEQEMLFTIARNSIKSKLFEEKNFIIDEKKITEALKRPLGAFVTLKINGVLRGCIGRFLSTDPLYDVIKVSALSSAFDDPRFPALTKDEYDKVDIEITVLGPMKKINNISEIKLGKHGIYIKKDFRAGTMLPQVAIEYGWTVEEFLGYTSRDKAGIGWDGWKTADIYIYEGLVLEENKK